MFCPSPTIFWPNSNMRLNPQSEEAQQSDKVWIDVCVVCLEYLLHINRTEVLFRDVYSMFVQGEKQELFLQLLEPFIISDRSAFSLSYCFISVSHTLSRDRLKYIGPEVMQAFVVYNAKLGKLSMVERCILHLDIASMDFHQVRALLRLRMIDMLLNLFHVGCNGVSRTRFMGRPHICI